MVRCDGCGLVQVHPLPTTEAVRAHYNDGRSSVPRYYLAADAADRRTFDAILDRIERLRPTRGQLLDVGPNVGTALAAAVARGWHARGVEINEDAARYSREQRGLDVVTGSLESVALGARSFDVVLMLDVIEHLLDPPSAVRRVHGLLRPGGLVVISTPDIARMATRLLQVKPAEHLFYFSAETLGRLLREAGFRVDTLGSLDRHRNLTAMGDSTTLRGALAALRPLIRGSRRVIGDLVVRLPLHENLLAIAVRT